LCDNWEVTVILTESETQKEEEDSTAKPFFGEASLHISGVTGLPVLTITETWGTNLLPPYVVYCLDDQCLASSIVRSHQAFIGTLGTLIKPAVLPNGNLLFLGSPSSPSNLYTFDYEEDGYYKGDIIQFFENIESRLCTSANAGTFQVFGGEVLVCTGLNQQLKSNDQVTVSRKYLWNTLGDFLDYSFGSSYSDYAGRSAPVVQQIDAVAELKKMDEIKATYAAQKNAQMKSKSEKRARNVKLMKAISEANAKKSSLQK